MAEQGVNIEVFFRQMFEIDDSVEIVPLMEAAISVVASKHPQELLKRRKRIIKTLMFGIGVDTDSEDDEINESETTTVQKTTCTSSKIDEERPKQQHHDIKIPARRKSDEKINVSCTNKVDQKKANMELKLEASKRKLQDGYSKNQEERTKRSIKVLDVKDIPAPQMKRMKALDVKNIPTPQKKNSCPRSRILKKISRPRTQLMRPLAY